VIKPRFWRGKRVFVTGHTGFKGSWLCLLLHLLGSKVTGYALAAPTTPNLFELGRIKELISSFHGDVRDLTNLTKIIKKAKSEIVMHLAAQPIVRHSYEVPVETFETNVMGTVNLLEAARACPSVKSIVVITTDKVYENNRVKGQGSRVKGFKENDPLGGYDPYSSSKAAAELVANSYQCSYGLKIATARAGNVIGGGDFASDRLVPDFVRSIITKKSIKLRHPQAVRPWQHVLEPLCGYLLLAQEGATGAWNFGPSKKDVATVGSLVKKLCMVWDRRASFKIDPAKHLHEAHYLALDSKKAQTKLGWQPKWNLDKSLNKIIAWTQAYLAGQEMREVTLAQIQEYLND